MVARVGELVDSDQRARLDRAAPGDAGDERVAPRQLASASRVRAGTAASSGSSTIGASVPSTSQRTAADAGSARRGAISSAIRGATAGAAVTAAVAVAAITATSIAARGP